MAVVGGLLLALGSILPWATATTGFGATFSRSGIEGGDGLITIVLGIGIALFASTMLRGDNLERWGITFVGAVVALVLLVIDYVSISDNIKANASDAVVASVGIGVWVAGIGALMAAGGALRSRPAGAP
jgi:hypothetical protein